MDSPAIDPRASAGRTSLWANRDFMLLWAAQAISQTAQHAVWYGILVLVQQRSNSSAHMGLAITSLVLPSVLFGLVAGVYVDRWDKRLVLVASNVLRAGAALAYLAAGDWLGLVYGINFGFATISQFFGPAEGASIPALVERPRLLQANSLFHLTFTASQVVGLVIVGPLAVNLLGLDGLFLAVAALFAVCAALVWPLPPLPAPRRTSSRLSLGKLAGALAADVREVLLFFRTDPLVSLSVAQWTLGAILSVVIAMLAPGLVVRVLGLPAEDSVLLLAPAGAGMLGGTVLLSYRSARAKRQTVVNLGLLALGAALALIGFMDDLWTALLGSGPGSPRGTVGALGLVTSVMALALVAGVAFVAVIVPAQTVMQERAPRGLRGRVIAIALMLGNLISVLPLVSLGVVADLIGVDVTLTLVGIALLGIALASWWWGRRLRSVQSRA